MKHLTTCALALLISMTALSQSVPTIQFDSRLYDFGDIKDDIKEASCTFTFKNSGKAPLIIQRAIASCGCTTPEFTKEPIVPGGSGMVRVTYNTEGRPNEFLKTITVYSNDPNNSVVILTIKGNVVPNEDNVEQMYPRTMGGLRLERTQLSILDATTGSIRNEKINIINATAKTIKLSFRNVPSHIRVVASDTELKPGKKGNIMVTYLVSQAKDYGRKEDAFLVVIDNNVKSSASNSIQVSAYITEDFSKLTESQLKNAPIAVLSSSRLNLGQLKRNEVKTQIVTLTNTGKTPLIIRKIVPEYDGLKLIPQKTVIPAGKSITLKMQFNAGTFNGNVTQRATIFTNDPKNSVTRLFVTAQVSPSN